MGLSRKQYANAPTVNSKTTIISLVSPGALPASAPLISSIVAALAAASVTNVPVSEITGLLISASGGNDAFVSAATASEGIAIPAGQSLFLPIEGQPSVDLHYAVTAGNISVMVFVN